MLNRQLTEEELRTCRICGYRVKSFFPWGEDGKTCSFEMCPCCQVDFGHEDHCPEMARIYRKNWQDRLKEQLKNILPEYL